MREVSGEHNVLDAEMVSELNRHMLRPLDTEQKVVLHIFTRLPLQRLEAQISLRPVAMTLIPEVRLFHPERHPAQARLGEEDAQVREAVEHAGGDHLAKRRRGWQAQEGHLFHETAPDLA